MRIGETGERDCHLEVIWPIVPLLNPQRPLQHLLHGLVIAQVTMSNGEIGECDCHMEVIWPIVPLLNPQRPLQHVIVGLVIAQDTMSIGEVGERECHLEGMKTSRVNHLPILVFDKTWP